MRCLPAEEGMKIIEKCHSSPYGGHYGAFRTHAKIWQSWFFWPTMYRDTRFRMKVQLLSEARKHQFQKCHTTDNQPLDRDLGCLGIDYMVPFPKFRKI
jgi:hypothetical protein